jgi:hypothetical protein
MANVSRGLLLSLLGILAWALLSAGAVNLIAGSTATGIGFGVGALAVLLVSAEGRLLRQLTGRPFSKGNLILLALVVAAAIGMEVIGTASSRFKGTFFDWAQLVGVAGLVLMYCLMLWQIVLALRTRRGT